MTLGACTALCMVKDALDNIAGWESPELSIKNLLQRSTLGHERQHSEDISASKVVQPVRDLERVLVNLAVLISVVLGEKSLWDFYDHHEISGEVSMAAGIAIYSVRYQLDTFMQTHRVHTSDWFELFAEIPKGHITEHTKVYISSVLMFLAVGSIWRGLWTWMDTIDISWQTAGCTSAICLLTFTTWQLHIS